MSKHNFGLDDLYRDGGFAALRELATKAGTDAQYLRQCATGWRGKRPSIDLAHRLMGADDRLTLAGIYRRALSKEASV